MRFFGLKVAAVLAAGCTVGVAVVSTEEMAKLETRTILEDESVPLTLVSVVKGGPDGVDSLEFHKDNLTRVMRQVPLGTPVAIISVAGAFRSGKSSLLSWFVRSLSGDEIDSPDGKGILGGVNGGAGGFVNKGGHKPHTQGMHIWSKPFTKRTGRGKKNEMAVLLVDTQGTFDHDTSTLLQGSLFGLSTTLSSCQIYNVNKQVQSDNLGGLALFLEYGTLAKELEGGQDVDVRPFQRLEFLVRDWQNWEGLDDPAQVELRTIREQFLEYMHGIFKKKEKTDNKKVTECFRDPIGGFGLPHPGMEAIKGSFDGDIADVSFGFRRLLSYYIQTIILDNLVATALPNIDDGQFVESVGAWVKLYNNAMAGGVFPDPASYVEILTKLHNDKGRAERLKEFKDGVPEEYYTTFMTKGDLERNLRKILNRSVEAFNPRGDNQARKEAREKLRADLTEAAKSIIDQNGKMEPWGEYLVRQSKQVLVDMSTYANDRVSAVRFSNGGKYFLGCLTGVTSWFASMKLIVWLWMKHWLSVLLSYVTFFGVCSTVFVTVTWFFPRTVWSTFVCLNCLLVIGKIVDVVVRWD
ncbi:unnamed protein product [Ectocarpus fasciculatus]